MSDEKELRASLWALIEEWRQHKRAALVDERNVKLDDFHLGFSDGLTSAANTCSNDLERLLEEKQ